MVIASYILASLTQEVSPGQLVGGAHLVGRRARDVGEPGTSARLWLQQGTTWNNLDLEQARLQPVLAARCDAVSCARDGDLPPLAFS